MHSFLYLKDAPIYEKGNAQSEIEVINFIDTHITCNYDMENPLIEVQKHKHTHTCYKNTTNKTCRFHYPLPVMPETVILEPFHKDIPNKERRKARENFRYIQKLMNEYYTSATSVSFEQTLKTLKMSYIENKRGIQSSIKHSKVF